MLWSQDAWPIAVFFLAVMLVACLAFTVIAVVTVNLITRNWTAVDIPLGMLLGVVTFLVVEGLMLVAPGADVEYNGEPRSFKAFLVHYQFIIDAIAVTVVVALWRAARVIRAKSAKRGQE
jgi:hypothetical protein